MENIIRKYLVDTIQKSRDESMSFEQLEQKILGNSSIFYDTELFADESERPLIGAEKLFMGSVSQQTLNYLVQIANNHNAKTLDTTGGHQINPVQYLIFYFDDIGYLSVEGIEGRSLSFWYPDGYQYMPRRVSLENCSKGNLELEIIETEIFVTPFFMLNPYQIPSYCVKMGQRGYSLLADFEGRNFGCHLDSIDHDYDFFKIIE